jgi:hypothetical protein
MIRLQQAIPSFLLLLALPIAAHFFFSPLGFNPSDEGVVLAGAERILDGQVPHKDFVTIRPAGSFYLHAPVAYLFNASTLLASRGIAWFQFGVICWCWLLIVFPKKQIRPTFEWAVAITAFLLSTHNFPMMAWHTIDAIMFASIGILLMERSRPSQSVWGWILLGASVLFRQNFALAIIVIWLIRGKTWQSAVSVLVPGLAYVLYLYLAGAMEHAIDQLQAQTSFYDGAVHPYLSEPSFWIAIAVGLFVSYLMSYRSQRNRSFFAGSILAFGILGAILFTLYLGRFTFAPTFALMGLALGLALFNYLAGDPWDRPIYRRAFLMLIVCWTASISLGYATPALMAGPLFLLCLRFLNHQEKPVEPASVLPRMMPVLLLVIALTGWYNGRLEHIYRDLPAHKLTQSISDMLPAAKGLRTNERTAAMVQDLRNAVEAVKGPYVVIPDLAAYWIAREKPNPLATDRAVISELYGQRARIESELANLWVIVQKCTSKQIAYECQPINKDPSYELGLWVDQNLELIEETDYYRVYSPHR